MAIREIRAIRSFFPPRSGHPKNPVNPAHPEILSKKKKKKKKKKTAEQPLKILKIVSLACSNRPAGAVALLNPAPWQLEAASGGLKPTAGNRSSAPAVSRAA
jgi:hypothetical protein